MTVIGIGVQKAATSWLFSCMLEHPSLRGALLERGRKELNFFNHRYEYGYDWYEACFAAGPWKNIEFSVLYFHDANVPSRLRRYNADARLLLMLRNPVDRAISQYRDEVRHGRVHLQANGFREAVQRNPSYVEQGLYGAHLERWLGEFDLEQLHIIDYADVCTCPAEVLSRTFEFLQVDSGVTPQLTHQRVNRAEVVRSRTLRRVFGVTSRGVRRALGATALRSLRSSAVAGRIRKHNRASVEIGEALAPDGSDRARLAETFAPDLERLGKLLGRDYAHWHEQNTSK